MLFLRENNVNTGVKELSGYNACVGARLIVLYPMYLQNLSFNISQAMVGVRCNISKYVYYFSSRK